MPQFQQVKFALNQPVLAHCWLMLLCLVFYSSGTHANEINSKGKPVAVLIGGDLMFCSSLTPDYCVADEELEFDINIDANRRYFSVTASAVNNLREHTVQYPQFSSPSMLKVIDILSASLSAQNTLATTSGESVEAVRRFTEKTLKIALLKLDDSLLGSLTHGEWQMILDHFEEPVLDKGFLREASAKPVNVSIAHTRDDFSPKAIKTMTDAMNGERLVLVTSGNANIFEDVSLIRQVFEQSGVDVTWLPFESTIRHAIDYNEDEDDIEKQCAALSEARISNTGRFNRHMIYPSLHAKVVEACAEPQSYIDIINRADGIFFYGDDASQLIDAFKASLDRPDKSLHPTDLLWSRIVTRYKTGSLVVGASGDMVHALGGEGVGAGVIVSGNSREGLLYGFKLDSVGQVKHRAFEQRLSNQQPNLSITTGLGLFKNVIFDTEFSNRGRQGRLLAMTTLVRPPLAIGIDSRTTLTVISDNTHLDMTDDVKLTINGEGGVGIFNLTKSNIQTLVPTQFEGVEFGYATSGDKVSIQHLVSGTTTEVQPESNDKEQREGSLSISYDFADWKFSSSHYGRSVIKGGKAFSSNNFFKTIYMLCTTGGQQATIKHLELGKGHEVNVVKKARAASVNGSLNVNGKNYRFCSYRNYRLDTKVLL